MKDPSKESIFKGTSSQIIAVLICTFSAISDGMQYAWTAPVVPILRGPNSPLPITEEEAGWLEKIYLIGGICGLPVTMLLVDRIGRKRTLMCAATSSLTGWVLIAAANRIEYLYVARFCTGLAQDVAFVSAPMYVAEVAEQKIRGFLAGVMSLMQLFGILVIYVAAPYGSFFVSAIIGCINLAMQLIGFNFIPESPYFLLSVGRDEEAKKALLRLRGAENVDKEMEDITKAVQRQNAEPGRLQDLILVKSNRKAIIIMAILNASQHFSSLTVMLMNLHSILEAGKSVYLPPVESAIVFAASMLLACFFAGFFIDKYGRKVLLTFSCICSSLVVLALAIYFTLQKQGVDVTGASWIPTVSVMLYAAMFRTGLGIIPLVLTSEIFPTKLKAFGMTVSDAIYLSCGIISLEVYQVLGDNYGLDIPFYVFSLCSLLAAGFCIFYIPETKGKTLEEIQFMLKGEPYPDKVTKGNVNQCFEDSHL